jgi:hypothetical protein
MEFIDGSSERFRSRQRAWYTTAITTHQADPFCCTPAWQLSFHEAFCPERRLLIADSANNVIAFAENVLARGRLFLTPIEAHWLFGCPLLGKEAVELLSDVLEFCGTFYAPIFPKIAISGIRPGGALARRLEQRFSGSFSLVFHSSGLQCAASLAGGTDGFLSRRSANHRHKLRKAARRAAEQGVRFERVIPASSPEAEEAYARMLAVERASWKGIGRCGMAEPSSKRFYHCLLQRLASSRQARIIFAKHENRDIGFIFGGMAGKIYRGQQFSFDDAWKRFSIGSVMQLEKIEWLCEEGAVRYDMGPLDGQKMEYKEHWTERRIKLQTWILQKK